jgi:hypothetical protein
VKVSLYVFRTIESGDYTLNSNLTCWDVWGSPLRFTQRTPRETHKQGICICGHDVHGRCREPTITSIDLLQNVFAPVAQSNQLNLPIALN